MLSLFQSCHRSQMADHEFSLPAVTVVLQSTAVLEYSIFRNRYLILSANGFQVRPRRSTGVSKHSGTRNFASGTCSLRISYRQKKDQIPQPSTRLHHVCTVRRRVINTGRYSDRLEVQQVRLHLIHQSIQRALRLVQS